MSLHPALRECACGHVANHHTRINGCGVSGCPCRAFDSRNMTLDRHNEIVGDLVTRANVEIRKAWKQRDEAREEAERLRVGIMRLWGTPHMDEAWKVVQDLLGDNAEIERITKLRDELYPNGGRGNA